MTIKLEKSLINRLQKLKVGIIGESIIDAYHFVDPIGKSSKSPTITANLLSCEYHAGGVLAIANHISGICQNVSLFTLFGKNTELDSKKFCFNNLKKNINLDYIELSNKPTTLKKRYVDNFFRTNKLLEVFEYNDVSVEQKDISSIIEMIDKLEKKSDLILIADFGHGLFEDEKIIKRINSMKKYLCLMVQTNSLNYGFNLVTKFKQCNYFCIDKREADLALQNKKTNYEEKIKKLALRLKADKACITLGKDGCIVFDKKDGVTSCPNFSNKNLITDTVGAGDAFFALTSLMSFLDVNPKILGDLGNKAGFFATQYLGNKKNLNFLKK